MRGVPGQSVPQTPCAALTVAPVPLQDMIFGKDRLMRFQAQAASTAAFITGALFLGVGPCADKVLPSPIHAFYHNKEQINGGRNNLFAAMSTVGGWTMGYFDGSKLKSWQWAKEYTLADNFFMGAFGGSYLNHQWLICACTPRHADAPENMRAVLDENGKLKKKPESGSANDGPVQVYSAGGGEVSPDGWSVNTTQPP